MNPVDASYWSGLRTFIAFLVSCAVAAGCSTSPCQHMADSVGRVVGTCQGTGIDEGVNVNECNLECSTAEQTALSDAATCLDALTACTPAGESAFVAAAAPCVSGLSTLSASCLASFSAEPVNNDDAGTPSGGNSVRGSVGGVSLNAQDAITDVLPATGTPLPLIAIVDWANFCSVVTGGANPASTTLLEIILGSAATTGTFTVEPVVDLETGSSGLVAVAELLQSDAECTATPAGSSESGTVTVTSVATGPGMSTTGTFTIVMTSMTGAGGTLEGSFRRPVVRPPSVRRGLYLSMRERRCS